MGDHSNRTHSLLRDYGIKCGKVERVVSGGKFYRRMDLFGFIDQVAILLPGNLLNFPASIYGIQDTGGADHGNGNARYKKILAEANINTARDWLTVGELLVIDWVRPKGKRGYTPYYTFVDLERPKPDWKIFVRNEKDSN